MYNKKKCILIQNSLFYATTANKNCIHLTNNILILVELIIYLYLY